MGVEEGYGRTIVEDLISGRGSVDEEGGLEIESGAGHDECRNARSVHIGCGRMGEGELERAEAT